MEPRPKPYVGITGFMDGREVDYLYEKINQELFATHDLMIGVLLSSKTMNGTPNKWPGRYPPENRISPILRSYLKTFPTVHFNTDFPANLANDLQTIYVNYAPYGIQLNSPFPPIDAINKFREKHQTRIILQIGRMVIEHFDGETERIVQDYIGQYADVITDVLFDLSEGRGEFLDLDLASRFLWELTVNFKYPLGYGIAGGLCAKRLADIADLAKRYPNMSIDAQGLLRTPLDDPHNNRLDLDEALNYAVTGLEMFRAAHRYPY